MFLGVYPFFSRLSSLLVCNCSQQPPIILCFSTITSNISLSLLVLTSLSLFGSIAAGLSILCLFSKDQLLVPLTIYYLFNLFLIQFHSDLCCFLPSNTFGFHLFCCCCCCQVASVVSNSVQPHRQPPTRFHHPSDSPGKNIGVDCHFLLQRMKVYKILSMGPCAVRQVHVGFCTFLCLRTYCSFTGTPLPTSSYLPTIPILHGPLLVMLIWHILPSEMQSCAFELLWRLPALSEITIPFTASK